MFAYVSYFCLLFEKERNYDFDDFCCVAHVVLAAAGLHTGVCEKELLRRMIHYKKMGFRSSESGAGLQFLPKDCLHVQVLLSLQQPASQR